jgi:hypothetical protein
MYWVDKISMSMEISDAGVMSMPMKPPGDFEDETAYAYCPGRSK